MIDDAGDFEYLVFPSSDQGLALQAEVTATNPDGSASALSNTVQIPKGTGSCEEGFNEVAPAVISGESEVTGTIWVSTEGVWDPCNYAIAGYLYQWFRNGTPIPNETEQSYIPSALDLGQSISARVIAVNGLGESTPVFAAPVTIGPEPSSEEPVYGPPGPPGSADCIGASEASICTGGFNRFNISGKFVDRLAQLDVRGVRAGIRTPRTNHFDMVDGSIGTMRIVVERQISPGVVNLAQAGFGRTEHFSIGECQSSPPDGKLYTFFETLQGSDPDSRQRCSFVSLARQGKSNLYTVYRKKRVAPDDNLMTWQVNINGRQVDQRWLDFDGGSVAIAGGEIIATPDGEPFHPDGRLYGCYGCTPTPFGVIRWQRTTLPGSTGWMNIKQAQNDNHLGDGRWQISNLPAPFTVFHPCDPQHQYGC